MKKLTLKYCNGFSFERMVESAFPGDRDFMYRVSKDGIWYHIPFQSIMEYTIGNEVENNG